jgi:hypothetical protein
MKLTLIALLLLSSAICDDEVLQVSIKFNTTTGNYTLTDGIFSNEGDFIAGAKYTRSLESKGWDLLAIKTNPTKDDKQQAEAAGYLEGYITNDRIWNHYRNMRVRTFKDQDLPANVREYLSLQETWLESNYANSPNDPILLNAYLTLAQFNGLRKAYNDHSVPERNIETVQFHVITSFGDLFDIKYYNNTDAVPDFNTMSAEKIRLYFHENNHCSALWKVKEDMTDVFFGHNSWFVYSAMTRIFKEYNFNFNNPAVKAKNVMFSSYPAVLSSNDDFYLTSQNLAVIETTNAIFEKTLYDKVTPNGLLCWQRAMVANRLATTSQEWTDIFSQHNSGTYNNQFMVLNMNLVDLDNQIIADDALYIIEQIPGYTETTNVSRYLKYGYWPSYNTPYSRNISAKSGIDAMIEQNPKLRYLIDYNTCVRANMFRRDQCNVVDDLTFKKVMRYNDYKNDKLSLGLPGDAIASRFDLNEESCGGAYDAKTTSVSKAKGKNKRVNLISGPTNDQQPNFKWNDSNICAKSPRDGLPEEFSYTWIEYTSEFQIDDTVGSLQYLIE